jgi:hypothetical protein
MAKAGGLLIRNWPTKPPRWHVHLTPTSASWPIRVERLFALIIEKKIRRRTYHSVVALCADIFSFIEQHNADPKPFHRTKPADDIVRLIESFCLQSASQRTMLRISGSRR